MVDIEGYIEHTGISVQTDALEAGDNSAGGGVHGLDGGDVAKNIFKCTLVV